jgi:DNA-binding response OmpR family regulator
MTRAPRVLVVEDELDIANLIKHALERSGDAQVEIVNSGDAALRSVNEQTPDLVILDLNLPVLSGTEVCRILRGRPATANVPIIMLTARTGEADRVTGLDLGADDYVTKPFSQRELLARIKAVLRRSEARAASRRDEKVRAYRFGGWELNTGTRRLASPDGRNVDLTNSEYALLVAFLRAPERVLSRDQLLESSRLHDDIFDRSIDVQILRLRRKIEESPNEPKLIKTERGAGYFLATTVETL